MRKTKLLQWYANWVWPIQRKFTKHVSKRCKTCILSEKAVRIFDDGQCEECKKFQPPKPKETNPDLGIETLVKEIKDHKSNTYDTVFLLSGGKDSAFVLHKIRVLFPELQILCVMIDNGFLSKESIENAQFTAKRLNVDFLFVRSFVPEFRTAHRKAFLELEGKGCYGKVDFADGQLIFKAGKYIAQSLGLNTMFCGLSWVQLDKIVGVDSYKLVDSDNFTTYFPMYFWRVDEKEIQHKVEEWKLIPKGQSSPLVSNSDLITAMGVVDVKTLGYSSFEPEFAQLVREGKTDRKSWLHLFELLEYGVNKGYMTKDADRILLKLGLRLKSIVEA